MYLCTDRSEALLWKPLLDSYNLEAVISLLCAAPDLRLRVAPDLFDNMSKLREIVLSTAARNLTVGVIGIPLLLVAYYTSKLVVESLLSPLRKLQGPPGGRFLSGHMLKMSGGECYETLVLWREKYGHVFSMRTILGVSHNSSN